MKRVLTVILTLSMIFALSACSLRDFTDKVAPTKEPEPEYSPAPTPTPAPQPVEVPAEKNAHPYKQVLDLYYKSLSENWGPSEMMENGVNYMLGYYEGNALDAVGFCIGDLDGDGVDEMLIGDIGGDPFSVNMIYDFYSIVNGEMIHHFGGTERSRFYMLDNGLLLNEGSSSAAHSVYTYYKLENSSFLFDEAVIFDSEMSEESDWFYTAAYDYESNPERIKTVTADEATAFIQERETHVTRPDYIPFSQYPGIKW